MIRPLSLSPSWFPRDRAQAEGRLSSYAQDIGERGIPRDSLAAVSPHAGWYYCGQLIALAFASLPRDLDTIVIFGGHLGPGERPRILDFEGFELPQGLLMADADLAQGLRQEIDSAAGGPGGLIPDYGLDNTVEVLLPFAPFFCPGCRLVALRAPNNPDSWGLGQALARVGRGRRLGVIASTDLCHYGPAYDYCPAGLGQGGRDWAESADSGFLRACLDRDAKAVLKTSIDLGAACSPGAVLALLGYLDGLGANGPKGDGPRGQVLSRAGSLDRGPADSFVGYAALAYYA